MAAATPSLNLVAQEVAKRQRDAVTGKDNLLAHSMLPRFYYASMRQNPKAPLELSKDMRKQVPKGLVGDLDLYEGARWSLLGAAAASGLLQGGGRGGHAPPVMEAEPSLERIVHAVQLQPGPAMLRPEHKGRNVTATSKAGVPPPQATKAANPAVSTLSNSRPGGSGGGTKRALAAAGGGGGAGGGSGLVDSRDLSNSSGGTFTSAGTAKAAKRQRYG